jgi:hypothetical protein
MTVKERQIARELTVIYTVYGLVAWGYYMISTSSLDWGSMPQWLTALIALCALAVAGIGIAVQWRLARRRAAVDFFLKTEADKHLLESVRRVHAGLHSFLSMRRIEARRKNASAFRLRFSQSLASLRQRLSQAMERSTIQRLGKTTNPLTRSERLTISTSRCGRTFASACANCGP